MKFFQFLAVPAAFLWLLSAAESTAVKPGKCPKGNDLSRVSLETLAAEFREIRKLKGHFAGGNWSEDVDRWNGRKHSLMIELGNRLAYKGKFLKRDVIRFLNPPDQIAQKGSELFEWIMAESVHGSSQNSTYEFLVYYWRGTHDFLYFTCEKDVIVDSGWWYALE